MNDKERTALECMHVFHTPCIDEYRNSSGLSLRYCCPYKCFRDEREAADAVDDAADAADDAADAADAVDDAAHAAVQAVAAPSDLLDAARALQ